MREPWNSEVVNINDIMDSLPVEGSKRPVERDVAEETK